MAVAVNRLIWRAALFLAMSDPAAHPALLAPYLATSFASATTGHAFSSGVSGKDPELNKNCRDAFGVNENADCTRKSVIISRSAQVRSCLDGPRPQPITAVIRRDPPRLVTARAPEGASQR